MATLWEFAVESGRRVTTPLMAGSVSGAAEGTDARRDRATVGFRVLLVVHAAAQSVSKHIRRMDGDEAYLRSQWRSNLWSHNMHR